MRAVRLASDAACRLSIDRASQDPSRGPTQHCVVRRFAVIWLVCVAALAVRRPDVVSTPQFYAEDGVIFFRDATVMGMASLFVPYSGYQDLVPRLVALVSSPLPFAWQPALYGWLTVGMQGGCCALLVPLLRGVVADAGLRAICAIAAAAVVPADELIGSVSNGQWYLALPVLAATFAHLEGGARTAARAGAVIVGLTTPEGVIALPFAIWYSLKGDVRYDRAVPALFAGSALLSVVTAPRGFGAGMAPHPLEAVFSATAFRVGDALVLGKTTAMVLAADAPWLGAAIGTALLCALFALVAKTYGLRTAATLAYLSLGSVALVMASRPLGGARVVGYAFFGADRYFVEPAVVVIAAIVMICARIRPVAIARAGACALLLPGGVLNLREPSVLSDNGWSTSAPVLETWRRARDAGGPVPAATVPIAPRSWSIVLPPCRSGARGGPLPVCP